MLKVLVIKNVLLFGLPYLRVNDIKKEAAFLRQPLSIYFLDGLSIHRHQEFFIVGGIFHTLTQEVHTL